MPLQMLPRDRVLKLLPTLTSQSRSWSIAEIADLLQERRDRVRSQFDRYRNTIFRPANNPNGNAKRLYDAITAKTYILFMTMRDELNYPGHQCELFLQKLPMEVLWGKYEEGLSVLGAYLIDHRPREAGAA